VNQKGRRSRLPDQADRRSAFNGLVQTLVQTTPAAGEISLVAASTNQQSSLITRHSH